MPSTDSFEFISDFIVKGYTELSHITTDIEVMYAAQKVLERLIGTLEEVVHNT